MTGDLDPTTASESNRRLWNSLSPDQRRELARLLSPKLTRYVPHRPTPKQAAFLLLTCQEVFFGGAAGGGKSDALLMGALQNVDVPGYAAILFRRTYRDLALPDALMDRANQWLRGTDATWHGDDKKWTFPSGATLSFGYLDSEDDKYRYQSARFDFIGFDELPQFTESQYRYLFSRARRAAGSKIPIRIRSAGNPDGPGLEWVRQRFIVEGPTEGRIFIPARMEDNPHLDQVEYRKMLAQLDPVTRARLELGDWDVRPAGAMFQRQWFEVVDVAPENMPRGRYWDVAATEHKPGKDPDWTAGALVGLHEGRYYILDVQRFRATPGDVEKRIRQAAEMDGPNVPVYMEQEPGASGVGVIDHYARRVLVGYSFYGNRSTGSKAERARPFSAAAEAGNVKLLRGAWIGGFLDEAEAFPGGGHDDQVDAVSGAISKLTQRGPLAVSFVGGMNPKWQPWTPRFLGGSGNHPRPWIPPRRPE